jgi:hypothetical protein
MVDGFRPLNLTDSGDRRHRHALARRPGEHEIGDGCGVTPQRGRIPEHHGEPARTVEDFAGFHAANRRLDDLSHIRDVQPVTGNARAIDIQLDLR